MESKDRRQEEDHSYPQKEQSGKGGGGGGNESPVFGIPQHTATTSPEQEQEQEQDAFVDVSAAEPAEAEVNDDNDDCDDEESEFEFAFVSREADLPDIRTADEIFSDGRIRPVYPLFDRGLFLYYQSQAAAGATHEEQELQKEGSTTAVRVPLRDLMRQIPASTSSGGEGPNNRESVDAAGSSAVQVHLTRAGSCSSSDGDLEGVPEDTYCLWTPGSVPPSPDHLGRKSTSTGSGGSRRWRLRDLVLGRSHSDGRHKLMFFQQEEGAAAMMDEEQGKKKDNGRSGKDEGKKKANDVVVGKDSKNHQKSSTAPPTTTRSQRKKKSVPTELDLATAHRLYYGKSNNNNLKSGATAGSGSVETQGQRRSSTSTFLPYRKDLFVGIFPHSRSPGRGGLGSGFSQGPSSFYGF